MPNPAKEIVTTMLLSSVAKDQWTECHYFRCVFNTGWAAGKDKYLCRYGKDPHTCGAIARNNNKPIKV